MNAMMDAVLRDPRFEYRQVVFILSEGDAQAFIAAREGEGWDLFLRQTLFDRDDKPYALGLGFRRKKESVQND